MFKKGISALLALAMLASMTSCMKSEEEKQVESKADEAFQSAESYFENEDYKSAIVKYNEVAKDTPNYEKAQERIEEANEKYKQELIKKAQSYADISSYSGAINLLEQALDRYPNDIEIKNKIAEFETAYVNSTIEKASEYLANENYVDALNLLSLSTDDFERYPKIASTYQDYTKKYINSVIKSADNLVKKNDYDAAIREVENALAIIPNNKTLSDKKTKLQNEKPIPLCEIKMSNSKDMILEESAMEDIVGNVYSAYNLFSLNPYWSCTSSYGEFYLGSDYSTITGTIAPSTSFGEDSEINIEIYGDGKLKASMKVTQKMLAKGIKADLTGVKWLKIQATEIADKNSRYTCVILSNFMLK